MNLVLSTDAKPRLKWTPELHQRFIEAVARLGGADKATPKTLVKTMGIAGLTLYHLKSHLQKFRLGKSQESGTYSDNSNYKEDQSLEIQFNMEINQGTQIPVNESLKVAQALQMQMEVQRKLHQQIEVQRHLQLRIEAQGKYLQSVVKKAQETLAGYNSSTGVEFARADLVSMVNNTNCCSSLSSFKVLEKNPMMIYTNGSKESSLTSSDSSSRNEGKRLKCKAEDGTVLPSTRMLQESDYRFASQDIGLSLSSNANAIYFLEQPSAKRSRTYESKDDNEFRMFGYAETIIDLNS